VHASGTERALELPADVGDQVGALQDLSKRAQDGDKGARRELRQAVRESSPEVIARCSDFARTYRRTLAKTSSGGDPLVEQAIMTRVEMMRVEIAGEDPTALELLLADRIVTLYMLVELLEALTSAQLNPELSGTERRVPVSYTLQMVKWQESANRRYLAAIRELARVRKLQAGARAAAARVDPRGSILAGSGPSVDVKTSTSIPPQA
jgi:hypothetical protein